MDAWNNNPLGSASGGRADRDRLCRLFLGLILWTGITAGGRETTLDFFRQSFDVSRDAFEMAARKRMYCYSGREPLPGARNLGFAL